MTPEQLVEAHLDLPTMIVSAYCKSRPSMRKHFDDLMSYGMEALWESAQRYESDIALFSTYAIHRIRWSCVDTARRIYGRPGRSNKRSPMLFTDFFSGNFRSVSRAEHDIFAVECDIPDDDPMTNGQWDRLLRCLSPHYRKVVEMRFRLGKSYAWIARDMGINVHTAMSIVSQAIKRMRKFSEVAA
ncbi:sigma-70 family RNA polymerase sigma factor [Tuwongella immobilis]|uniref:Rna polymerase factor sigma-70:: Sigma70_r2: Sigma70_r4_2 n=1 Tax=Tuwongella immobilis TaxID=692036 RepID=A0A6C2YXT3_9BACT|nr:sigma-70 family RNA polymerase sigma factor [Tuwongella immobilis]VIP05575.1 rna polymerase factor sigma-70 : : Sigma70_r2: Sigma70_r4_2 [Tuwongella immobilis]VTS08505.1 rna polymerase factor sigma-70 : : Sigma70_r2: Sigma70_r4_2 [Tuwongella immobilis]